MIGPLRTAPRAPARRIRGVTLIELMVSLVLGMVVTGAALAVFITNRQTYIATESLGRLQEGSRVAFELMSRDLREAAMVPCGNETELSTNFNNIVDSAEWWRDWSPTDTGMKGLASDDATIAFGTAATERAAAAGTHDGWTDAVDLKAAVPPGPDPIVVTEAKDGGEDIPVNSTAGLSAGDILMACDYGYGLPNKRGPSAVLFQATGLTANTIVHAEAGTIGNTTSAELLTGSAPLQLQPNGMVSVLHATRWYIGHNAHGGLSLYRDSLRNEDGTPAPVADEIVEGADGLALTYLVDGGTGYIAASAVSDWSDVVAVRIQLHLTGTDRVDGDFIQRTLEHVVTIRNRAS